MGRDVGAGLGRRRKGQPRALPGLSAVLQEGPLEPALLVPATCPPERPPGLAPAACWEPPVDLSQDRDRRGRVLLVAPGRLS